MQYFDKNGKEIKAGMKIARKGGGCFAINKHLDNVCGNDNFNSY